MFEINTFEFSETNPFELIRNPIPITIKTGKIMVGISLRELIILLSPQATFLEFG
jgi:hypothetical protein